MKKKKKVLFLLGITIIILGILLACWLFRKQSRKNESKKLKEYAEQICLAFEKGDISTFDELCDNETVFYDQNIIYKYLREELKYNLEHKKYQVTEYWVSDSNESGIESFSLNIVCDGISSDIRLNGWITVKRKGKKLYINHFNLNDSSVNQIHYEIVGSNHPNFNIGPYLRNH